MWSHRSDPTCLRMNSLECETSSVWLEKYSYWCQMNLDSAFCSAMNIAYNFRISFVVLEISQMHTKESNAFCNRQEAYVNSPFSMLLSEINPTFYVKSHSRCAFYRRHLTIFYWNKQLSVTMKCCFAQVGFFVVFEDQWKSKKAIFDGEMLFSLYFRSSCHCSHISSQRAEERF